LKPYTHLHDYVWYYWPINKSFGNIKQKNVIMILANFKKVDLSPLDVNLKKHEHLRVKYKLISVILQPLA